MKYLDWNPSNDKNIRQRAVELHEKLHKRMSQKDITKSHLLNQGKRKWRRGILNKAEQITGKDIHGKILEIGCGDGYLSAYIAETRPITCVYAMEYDKPAVETLIPKAFAAYATPEDKYKIVYGSFNDIKEDGFDYIVSMGAIHHSENLQLTLKSCYNALSTGGYFIASEPCLPNTMTNAKITSMLEATNKGTRFGEEFVAYENSDHFYRLCEYETAAYHAGFDVYPFIFTDTQDAPKFSNLHLAKKSSYRNFNHIALHPNTDDYDTLFLLLHKPNNQYIPNEW